ncbi:hypothetical protein [Streptomyces sp. XY431]|uniref:hypothetical protein n=1 Tax=Streptomyces sp. XY431 TaxID=1415562 RepID=UPI00336C2A9F
MLRVAVGGAAAAWIAGAVMAWFAATWLLVPALHLRRRSDREGGAREGDGGGARDRDGDRGNGDGGDRGPADRHRPPSG